MRIDFDPDDEDTPAYPLLTALVVPRPIAWVSTVDADGTGNLAPHSFFTVACANPPIICFSSVGEKDTLRNVEATGEFVVNLATEPLLEAVNDSSAPYDAEVDEARALGLAVEPSVRVRAPRVAASPASLECTLHSTVPLGDSTLVLGRVVTISVDESALEDGHPSMAALRPLSRLGKAEWGRPPEVFTLPRPSRAPEDR